MKAYKGFNKDLTCMGYRYEIGKTYECEDAEVCDHGFHACLRPADVFAYYAPVLSRYCEVDVDEDGLSRSNDDSKVAARRITIVREISLQELHEAQLEYARDHAEESKTGGNWSAVTGGYRSTVTGGNRSSVTGGNRSAVTGGDGSAVTGGNRSSVTSGNRSTVTGGDESAVTGGDRSAVTGGDRSAVTGGDRSAVTGGDESAVTGGDRSVAVSRGSVSVGHNGLGVCRGNGCRIRGGISAVLVIAEENTTDYNIATWKAFVVDGETIKADTWYKLIDGELVEDDQGGPK